MVKLRVGILMGGMSVENEVSFNSGRTVYDNLDKNIFEPINIFQKSNGNLYILPQKFLYRGKIADFESRLDREAKRIYWEDLKGMIDFAYIAMHGRYAEDGTLQGMLQILNIPYLGTKSFGSALTRDKFLLYEFVKNLGIDVPEYIEVSLEQILNFDKYNNLILESLKIKNIKFPCIVKPHKEGSSIGVHVCKNEKDLKEVVLMSASCIGVMQPVLIEEKIIGKEFTSIVITDPESGDLITLPPTEIEIESNADIFDYDQKYMPGRATKHTPARFSELSVKKIQDISYKIMKSLDIRTFVRIDGFLLDDGNVVIIDVNTISGMAPSSFLFRQAAEIKMSHSGLINALIKAELNQYKINYN